MRKCLNDGLYLLPAAIQKESGRFAHRYLEAVPRETLRQGHRVVEILHDFKCATIVQFAHHQLLPLVWQLVIGGGAARFAATIDEEDLTAGTQRISQHIQKSIEAFERYMGEPEAEKDTIKGAWRLPVEEVCQHILDSLAVDPGAIDGNHLA